MSISLSPTFFSNYRPSLPWVVRPWTSLKFRSRSPRSYSDYTNVLLLQSELKFDVYLSVTKKTRHPPSLILKSCTCGNHSFTKKETTNVSHDSPSTSEGVHLPCPRPLPLKINFAHSSVIYLVIVTKSLSPSDRPRSSHGSYRRRNSL